MIWVEVERAKYMSGTKLYKKSDLQFVPYGHEPGKSTLCNIITSDVSKSMGAGIATFDDTSIEWTVVYDEVIVCLRGLFRLRVGEEVFEAAPGDVIWIPENTKLAYEGDGAEVFFSLYPADWRETRL